MKKLLSMLFVGAILMMFAQPADAQCGVDPGKTKVYALAFYADYCGACKSLEPNLKTLVKRMEGKPVKFVTFDFSSEETKTEAAKKAEELGLKNHLANNKGTGYVVLVDVESQKAVGKLTHKQSVSEMTDEVSKHL